MAVDVRRRIYLLHNTILLNFYKYVDSMKGKLEIEVTIDRFHLLHINVLLYPCP